MRCSRFLCKCDSYWRRDLSSESLLTLHFRFRFLCRDFWRRFCFITFFTISFIHLNWLNWWNRRSGWEFKWIFGHLYIVELNTECGEFWKVCFGFKSLKNLGRCTNCFSFSHFFFKKSRIFSSRFLETFLLYNIFHNFIHIWIR